MNADVSTLPSCDFRAVFESLPGSYLVMTPDLTIVAISDAFLRGAMRRREELVGVGLFTAFQHTPDDPEADGSRNLRLSLARVLATGAEDAMPIQKWDIPRRKRDGGGIEERYWSVANSALLDDEGRVAYLIHRVEDVTAFVQLKQSGSESHNLAEKHKRRADQMELEVYTRGKQLEKLNRQLTSLLNNTTTCVYAVDAEWKLTYINDNARRILDAPPFLLGKMLWNVFDRVHAATRAKLEQVMVTREPIAFESYYEPLELWSEVNAHPADDGGITLYFHDISERRRLEQQTQARALLEQRAQVLARIAAEMAHEIRNPLAVIHAQASDLAERAEEGGSIPAKTVEETCLGLVQTCDRAIRTLRGLSFLAREGADEPMRRTVVSDLVEEAAEVVRGRYRTHGVELETQVPAELPRVVCRRSQMEEVLVNLLDNAFDATDGAPANRRWVRVEVSLSVDGGGVPLLAIDVTDGGPAIAPEVRPQIMEAFFTTKQRGGGSGIGLSVSQTIAREHGGELTLVDGTPHTCLRLLLPFEPSRADEVAA